MFSTKTRNTIIAGLATLGVAITAVAPAVSQAQIKDPGTHAATCEIYRLTYELREEQAEKAASEGQWDLSDYYAEQAHTARVNAEGEGCAWVSQITHKTPKTPVSVKVGSSSNKALLAKS